MNTRRPIQDLSGATMAGRYLLERRVGCGGFASVYRAVDQRLGSTVAVKVLHPENTRNVKDVDRFFNEARIAGRINDERLVKVFDFFQDGDRCGFVMEHLEGRTLRDLLVEQEGVVLWWPRAFKVALEVCQALDVAHNHDIVHRDIKPENIFLMRARGGVDRVKLLDLGIAKVLQSWSGVRQGISNARDIIGSPFYMAPEQVEGTTGCDGRADIYSLGVVLYEMVTGEVPFKGNNDFETMYHHVKSTPTPPLTLRPSLKLPRSLEGIIMTALEKAPDRRFRNVQEMAKTITFELERTSSKQRVWHIAQMLPAVADDLNQATATTQPVDDEAATTEIAAPVPSQSTSGRTAMEPAAQRSTSGRVVEDMTTQKRVAAGIVRALPTASQPRETSSFENDLTPAPKAVDHQPSGNTKITSPDVEVASSESRPVAPRPPTQLPLHPRSIMMLASMVAASLIATCSAGSVLATVLDARHGERSGADGRGRVEVVAADDAEEAPQAQEPAPTPKVAAAPAIQAAASTQVTPPVESPPVESPPVESPSVDIVESTKSPERPSPTKKPPRTPSKSRGEPVVTDEQAPALMPIKSTMSAIANRASAAIYKHCKISRHGGQRSHEYRVQFTVQQPTGQVIGVSDTGETPIMVRAGCVTEEAKRIVKSFAGATDLRESYDHTFTVVRE